MVSHVLGIFQKEKDCSPPVQQLAPQLAQQLAQWPALPGRLVSVGGVTVTYAQASSALTILSAAGGVMVAQVLAAAGNPLASCDYQAAAQPFRVIDCVMPAGAVPGRWGRGAAGRPATRAAFMEAITAALAAACDGEPARHFAVVLHAARAAFLSDSGYAAAMAKAAVAVQEREHAAGLRAHLARGVQQAVSACASHRGQFTCTASGACGTGDCRFAAGVLSDLHVPAGPGRMPRPANHLPASPGMQGGFSTAAAAAALEKAVPYVVGVRVTSGDSGSAVDRPSA